MRFSRKQFTMGTTLLLGFTILVGGCGGGGGGGGGDSQTPLTTYKITGKTGSSGATVVFSSAGTATVTTDGFGNYSTRLPSGSYTVTPVKTGQIFQPMCQAVSVGGNLIVPDFTTILSAAPLYKVSGQAKNGSAGIPWMKISIEKAFAPVTGSTFTDSNGNYQFAGVQDGEYVITLDAPSVYMASYLFDPDYKRSIDVSGADVPGQNFTAVPRGSGSATVDF